jgi:hypothetical protein
VFGGFELGFLFMQFGVAVFTKQTFSRKALLAYTALQKPSMAGSFMQSSG